MDKYIESLPQLYLKQKKKTNFRCWTNFTVPFYKIKNLKNKGVSLYIPTHSAVKSTPIIVIR